MGRWRRWRADERGGATIEYGVIAVLIALVMVAGVRAFEVTMEFRAKRIAAALERSDGGATAAIRNAGDDIVTGSIRRKGE